jgi:hypothetical protein
LHDGDDVRYRHRSYGQDDVTVTVWDLHVRLCARVFVRIELEKLSRQIETIFTSLSLLNTTQSIDRLRGLARATSKETRTKRERENVLKRRRRVDNNTTTMGWLKRAASSVKSAMGFGDDGEDDDGSSSRRRSSKSSSSTSSKKKEEQKVRYPVLQFAQSPITGEFIGGVQGLSWFCESLRENGDGDVAHEFRREDEETAGREPSRRVKSGTFFPMRVQDGNVEMFRRNS